MPLKPIHKAGAAGAGGAIAIACVFIQPWEGLWTTAKVDTIGTGKPVTVCYGATRAELPTLKAGQQFTQEQCAELLEKGLPKYWNGIAPCIHVSLPEKTKAALISAAYNAGPAAVCRSPMVARMNAGKIKSGCEQFPTWYIRSGGQVRRGLVNRRTAEMKLCLEGLTDVDVNRAAKADRLPTHGSASPVPVPPRYSWTDYVRNWWRLHFH